MSNAAASPPLTGQTTPVDKASRISTEKALTSISLQNEPTADTEKLQNEAIQDYQISFTGDDDPRSPKSMSTARKWLIVMIVSSTSLCVACTSSLYAEAYGQVMEEFNCSEEVATLGLSIFVVGLGLSPMMLAPLSEVSCISPLTNEFNADYFSLVLR
jgi:hypothetical protein